MPKSYPTEFRRRALDRIEAGHTIRSIAHDLEVSEQMLSRWRTPERVDAGLEPGGSSMVSSELRSTRREIERLRAELAVTQLTNELLKPGASARAGSRR